jgi:transcription-repair coupling factor (superfamily II helicase)
MYHKILDEAVQELKETEFQELFKSELESLNAKSLVKDCVIETDLAVVIPETYVSNISERLSLYNTLDNLKNEPEMAELKSSVRDRFGPLPGEVEDLFETVKLRWKAEKAGFEKVTLKNETLRAYFISDDQYFKSEVFGKVLQFAQANPKKCRLKEINNRPILIINDVESIEAAIKVVGEICPEHAVA